MARSILALTLCLGCAAQTARPPAAPVAEAAPSATAVTAATPPSAVPAPLIPPPPAVCSGLAQHRPESRDCGADATATWQRLDQALAHRDAESRDAALAAMEGCTALEPGVMRLLRAELAPVECADAIVQSPGASRAPVQDVRDALRGLELAAQLSRLVRTPPRLSPPFDRARFDAFLKQELAGWIRDQAKAIHELSTEGARLSGYGKGVVAVEAGLADMRFVEVVRDVPLPEELARDRELSDVYFGALDEALEPRKTRGRDAALVGLKMLAEQGVLGDPRIDRARQLLSTLYNGRRIDALDGLLLPPLEPQAIDSTTAKLAAVLPTFVAGRLLSSVDPNDPVVLRALLARGLPPVLRQRLPPKPSRADTAYLAARAHFASGQLYWRSSDFASAREAASAVTGGPLAGHARVVAALAKALEKGPQDAADMMHRGPRPEGIQDVSPLDALSGTSGELGGIAAYDAAFILGLAPPADKAKPFWLDLERRYRRAAQHLTIPEQRELATDRAQAAADTAAHVR